MKDSCDLFIGNTADLESMHTAKPTKPTKAIPNKRSPPHATQLPPPTPRSATPDLHRSAGRFRWPLWLRVVRGAQRRGAVRATLMRREVVRI